MTNKKYGKRLLTQIYGAILYFQNSDMLIIFAYMVLIWNIKYDDI